MVASEAQYLACRYSPHVTCPRAGAGGKQAGVLTEPSHTPGQETAGRPDTDGTCDLKVRSENFPDFHFVTSWGHVDRQPAHPHGAEKGWAGQEGVSTGSVQAKDGTGCRGATSGPQSPASSILPT